VTEIRKMCQSCRVIPGSKRVLSDNRKKWMWKCLSCIGRKSQSFILSNKARKK
jgi:hypothetical protein